jgi:hypothetical protein
MKQKRCNLKPEKGVKKLHWGGKKVTLGGKKVTETFASTNKIST